MPRFAIGSHLSCGSIAVFCDWPTPAVQLLSPCFVLGSACRTVLSPCFVLGSRLLFAACAPNRTACGMFRSCSAVGRDRHSCVLGCRAVIELGWFTSGLRVSLWRSRQRTKETERTRGTRERSRRRGRVRFCVNILSLSCFPRGVRWGLRAPKPAPKSLRLSGLSSFDSRQSTSCQTSQ